MASKQLPGDAGKSICSCGHIGDGNVTDHAGLQGHGPCAECPCCQFTWAGWTPEYERSIQVEP